MPCETTMLSKGLASRHSVTEVPVACVPYDAALLIAEASGAERPSSPVRAIRLSQRVVLFMVDKVLGAAYRR